MRLSEKWREWKMALTFSEFCSFGEQGKLQPEQGSMARAGQQATSPVMDVRETCTLWTYKKYQFLSNVRYPQGYQKPWCGLVRGVCRRLWLEVGRGKSQGCSDYFCWCHLVHTP